MLYALFHRGVQASKTHNTKWAALIEAYEHGAVVQAASERQPTLADGWEIREWGAPSEDGRDGG